MNAESIGQVHDGHGRRMVLHGTGLPGRLRYEGLFRPFVLLPLSRIIASAFHFAERQVIDKGIAFVVVHGPTDMGQLVQQAEPDRGA